MLADQVMEMEGFEMGSLDLIGKDGYWFGRSHYLLSKGIIASICPSITTKSALRIGALP